MTEIPILFEDFLDGTLGCTRKYKVHNNNESIKWCDIQNSLIFASDQKNHALVYMKRCLGYIPAAPIYLPHLSFVQSLLQNMQSGVTNQGQFIDEIIQHMKHIRNDDMKKDGWIQCRNYRYDMRKIYKELLPMFKEPARIRLSSLLGFEPEMKYSMAAEIYLRTLFEKDYFRSDLPFCEYDFKAATIVMYRKAYYIFDEQVADQSQLFSLDFNPFVLTDEQNFKNAR